MLSSRFKLTPFRALFAVQLIFSIIFSFASLFINVYLWNQQQSFWNIGVFNLFSVQSIFFSSLAGAYILHQWGTRSTFIFSSSMALLLFSYLFYAEHAESSILPLLGILYGGYVGLFYIGFNLQILWRSNQTNRSRLVGLESTIATLAQLLTPLSAGIFITANGYGQTFFLIMGLLLLQLLFSFRVPQTMIRKQFRKRYFFLAQNEEMADLGFSSAAYGFYFAFVQMSYGLFFYFSVQDEFELGLWNFVFGGISALMYWLVGRLLKQSNRQIFLGMGMMASVIVTLTLLLSLPSMFILFNLVVSVSLPLLWIPTKTMHYNQMVHLAASPASTSPQPEQRLGHMIQLLVFREFAISLGRVCFFLFIVIGFDLGIGISYYIVVIFALMMPMGIWLLSRKE